MGRNVLHALQGQTEVPVPIWLMRQAGRYLPEYRKLRARAGTFLEFCYTPGLAVEATLQPVRRFDVDAAILFSDILVVPDAMGVGVAFREGEGPVVEVVDRDRAGRLRASGVADHLGPVYEAAAAVRAQLEPGMTLIGFAGAPWTVAAYMLEGKAGSGGTNARARGLQEPELVREVLDRLVEATLVHLDRQVAAGVDVVQLFESWAGVLDARSFREWVIEPTKMLVGEFKRRHPEVPVVGFPRGAGTGYRVYAMETGVDAVSLDSAVATAWAVENLGSCVALQGNLDNLVLRQGGPAMEERVSEILTGMAGGPFVFNLGHGVLPDTPPQHVAELVEMVHRWMPAGGAP